MAEWRTPATRQRIHDTPHDADPGNHTQRPIDAAGKAATKAVRHGS
jgi:hypothetical protein